MAYKKNCEREFQESTSFGSTMEFLRVAIGKLTEGSVPRYLTEVLLGPSGLTALGIERWAGRDGKPQDIHRICRATRMGSEKEMQRAMLEFCAVGMSTYQRDQLLGSHGHDGLYKALREEVILSSFCGRPLGVEGSMLKQYWYNVTDEGQREQVAALYSAIRSNPSFFIHMLR